MSRITADIRQQQPVVIQCSLAAPGGTVEGSGGAVISEAAAPAVTFKHNTVAKYSPLADDVIMFDVSALDSEKCSTMELWLTLGEVVSFSIADVTWVEEPSFDSANTLYALVIRWDGEKLIGNAAYSLEVTE